MVVGPTGIFDVTVIVAVTVSTGQYGRAFVVAGDVGAGACGAGEAMTVTARLRKAMIENCIVMTRSFVLVFV